MAGMRLAGAILYGCGTSLITGESLELHCRGHVYWKTDELNTTCLIECDFVLDYSCFRWWRSDDWLLAVTGRERW